MEYARTDEARPAESHWDPRKKTEAPKLAARAKLYLFTRLVFAMEAAIARTRDGNKTFLDPAMFPWVRELEARWRDIRAELDALTGRLDHIPNFQEIHEGQSKWTQDDRWKTFIFKGYGDDFEPNWQKCPNTAAILKNVPDLTTVMFSIMGPKKHIPPHRGPYKGVLRYQLALRVPDEKLCRIRVGDDVVHWQEGKSILFDDSFEHEAWNDSDELRVVLFVDVVRPLPWPLSAVNRWLLEQIRRSPYIQHARVNLERWEARLAAS
jgi:ornithine lipid ester-linked acyl 2-hydroxylase